MAKKLGQTSGGRREFFVWMFVGCLVGHGSRKTYGDHSFCSLFTLPIGSFWVPLFDPQPECKKAYHFMNASNDVWLPGPYVWHSSCSASLWDYSWFCFSGDFLFFALLSAGLLGLILYFSRLLLGKSKYANSKGLPRTSLG